MCRCIDYMSTIYYANFIFIRYLFSEIEKERTKSLGKAALGGEWNLTTHNGTQLKSSDMKGKWAVIYFGFCHCPDICPDELEKLCKVVDRIGI